MQFSILTPDRTVYEGNVKLVQMRRFDGSFAVLDMHAPMISNVEGGTVRIIDENDQEIHIDIKNGIFEVANNRAMILFLDITDTL